MKIVVLQGIPCSGKSTWAREFVKNKTDWAIVNRDSIRLSRGDYWIPTQEDYISKLEEYAVKAALESNLNVIIDATNLNPKTITKWQYISETTDSEIEFKFFDVSVKEAIARDIKRGKEGGISVGDRVIKDFYNKYVKGKFDKKIVTRNYCEYDTKIPHCIICDIDGTVANMNGRSPYDYSAVSSDVPDFNIISVVVSLASNIDNCQLLFVSGRPDSCREATIKWLEAYIPIDFALYMRKDGDWRKDATIKEEIHNEYIKGSYNVWCVFDDRDQTVAKWRELGLLTFQVADGNF